jgi:hypothetical protein
MKIKLLMAVLAGFTFTACTNNVPSLAPAAAPVRYAQPSEAKLAAFHPVMTKVALSTREDPKYNRMALDTTEKKEWFQNLMYRLWNRDISKGQFISEGLAKYPTHRYEFNFIANGFQKYS